MKVPFNRSAVTGQELEYLREVLYENRSFAGDGPFSKKCEAWLEAQLGAPRVLLTPSCTAALELAALLAGIGPGDEVIMPSYTFVSTANAFVLRGARIVFVDLCPETMNLDESLIEAAITERTKAIVPVHYAGVGCHMDAIMALAQKHGLAVIEDAAQGIQASYRGRFLGSIGQLGCFSFHETKNCSAGEGGALIINDPKLIERAEILREKGTNRSQFYRGQVDKYTWQDLGSSYLPSEFQAAVLLAQLESSAEICADRLRVWQRYYDVLSPMQESYGFRLPIVPEEAAHNGHLFFLKLDSKECRDELLEFLNAASVQATFHYVPLHSSPAGRSYGRLAGVDRYTTSESERLLRLPLYYGMSAAEQQMVVQGIVDYFDQRARSDESLFKARSLDALSRSADTAAVAALRSSRSDLERYSVCSVSSRNGGRVRAQDDGQRDLRNWSSTRLCP